MEVPFAPDAFSAASIEALRRATAESPKTAGAACRVAGLQLRLGHLAGARATMQAARDRFPQSWVVWKFDGQVNLEERGPKAAAALEAAIASFRRAAELADRPPLRADLLLTVGICLGHCGKPDEELSVYREVIEMMPHNAPA